MLVEITLEADAVSVTATVNTDDTEDETTNRLAGLALDDMVTRAADGALRAWSTARAVIALAVETEDGE